MRLKKLGAALVVVAALAAVLASSALAAAATEDVKWYTGASPGTELTGSETMSATAVGNGFFRTTVAGTEYELKSTGVSCVECKIENSGGVAVGSGKLKFTGVSVVKPAGCTVATEITSKALSVQADWMFVGTNYVRFVPTAGETTTFATVEVTGCALATTINPKGTVFVRSQNQTGTQAVEQEVHSSAAINSTAGGSLKVGEEAASLEASAKFKMSGAKEGTAFGTHGEGGAGGAVLEPVAWYTGASPGTELSGSETMSAAAVEPLPTFATTVGETKYKVEATGVECVECKVEVKGGDAVGSGKLKFTGLKVLEPAGCSVATEITTKALTWTGGWMIGGANYIRFSPTAGETEEFASIAITGCGSATTLVPKGTLFVQSQNATNIQAVEQEMHSSEAINAAAGGTLKVGTKTAVLTSNVKFKMSGAKAGTAFGTH